MRDKQLGGCVVRPGHWFLRLLVVAACSAAQERPLGAETSSDVVASPSATGQEPESPSASPVIPPSASPPSPVEGMGPAEPAGHTLVARSVARVFFSGHSLLDNPMPDWVELIATSQADALEWEEQIVIGSPIRIRTRGEDSNGTGWPGYALGKGRAGGGIDVLAELATPRSLAGGEHYDTLVITERHDLLSSVQWENTIGYLSDYYGRLLEHNGAATTLLYQVWPDIDKAAPERWTSFVREELYGWECVAESVNRARRSGSDSVGVIPGALALARLVERALEGSVPGLPRTAPLDSIFRDNVHLTPVGTYLLSALHYAALFGKSPVGAGAPAEIPSAAAPVLQQLAWETLTAYRATRTPWAHSAPECQTHVANVLCPAYYAFHGEPARAEGCSGWASGSSPLAP